MKKKQRKELEKQQQNSGMKEPEYDILRKRTAGKRVDSECSLSIEELGDVIPQGNTPETELECKELNCAIERFVEMLSKTETLKRSATFSLKRSTPYSRS